MDVPRGDVHFSFHLLGSVQPQDLHPDPEGQHGTGQAVQTAAERNRDGNHAHMRRHRLLRLQRFGFGRQCVGGKSQGRSTTFFTIHLVGANMTSCSVVKSKG